MSDIRYHIYLMYNYIYLISTLYNQNLHIYPAEYISSTGFDGTVKLHITDEFEIQILYHYMLLIHWGWVMHISVNLTHHWFRWNQCWNIVNWTPRNKFQWNMNRNSSIFIQDPFENVVWKMPSICCSLIVLKKLFMKMVWLHDCWIICIFVVLCIVH